MTRFEWDQQKNLSNQRKHGICFEDVIAVFADGVSVSWPSRTVDYEERSLLVGILDRLLLVAVVYTTLIEDTDEEVIRIISARRATPRERRTYEITNRKLHT